MVLDPMETIAFDLFGNRETAIKQRIEKANYCQKTDDCAVTGSDCMGCWNYTNKIESAKIAELISNPTKNCDCGGMSIYDQNPICKNNKCSKPGEDELFENHSCSELAVIIQKEIGRYGGCSEYMNAQCQPASKLGVPSEFACGIAITNAVNVRIFELYYKKCPIRKIKCAYGQRTMCINNKCQIAN